MLQVYNSDVGKDHAFDKAEEDASFPIQTKPKFVLEVRPLILESDRNWIPLESPSIASSMMTGFSPSHSHSSKKKTKEPVARVE